MPAAAPNADTETIGRRLECRFGIVNKFDDKGRAATLVAAAYNLCGTIDDPRDGKTFNFSKKSSEFLGHFVLRPDGVTPQDWHDDPAQFWLRADESEKRVDSQVARQIRIGMPRGLERERYQEFTAHALAPLTDAGMLLHADMHDPGASDGGSQGHIHLLGIMRELEPDGAGFRKNKQGKPREWNRMFLADDGRTMRRTIQARMNNWLAEWGYADRVELMSNLELHGPEALPPEPVIPRAEVERRKRNPDYQSADIISLENHRALRRDAVGLQHEARGLSGEILELEKERQRLLKTENYAMAKRPQGQRPAWMAQSGGYDALSPDLQQSARRSYDRWKSRPSANGKTNGDLHSLSDYVSYVQGQRNEERGWRFERPSDDANTVRRAPLPDVEILDSESSAPERQRARDQDDEDYPAEDGWTRETRFRARLLAGHYKISEAALSPQQLAAIMRISIDKARGVATIELNTGDVFEDFGDRIVSPRDPSPETATEIARAAQLHGWSSVALTGTPTYRDEVAIALGLLEPPVSHDWQMSAEAQERLAAALEARAAAIENTNAIRPVVTLENAIEPTEAPAPETIEAPLQETKFVLPGGGTATLSEMRSHPALAAAADRMATMSDEQLESRLKSSFPHYNHTGDDTADTAARQAAIAAWKTARAARTAQENTHAPVNPHTHTSPAPRTDSLPDGMGALGPSPGNGPHAAPGGSPVDEQRPSDAGRGNRADDNRPPSVAAAPQPVLVNVELRTFRRAQFDKVHDAAQEGYAHLITKGVPESSPEFRAIKARVDALRLARDALDARDPEALAAMERGDFQALLRAGDEYQVRQDFAALQARHQQQPATTAPQPEQESAPSPD